MSSPQFWIFPIALLGACVGSFLNVVIYRLPRGLSVSRPRWSFCPQCEHRIRPFDNIPLIGWLLLAGRCRDCRLAIPPMYPIVEALTALTFVAVWDAIFIAQVVVPAAMPATQWPTAVAMLTLFSSLMAMSVMDLETYTVDIRLCNFTVAVGIACAAIQGWIIAPVEILRADKSDVLPPVIVVAAIAAGVGWFVVHLPLAWLRRRSGTTEGSESASEAPPPEQQTGDGQTSPPEPESRAAEFVAVGMAAFVLLTLAIWIIQFPDWPVWGGLKAGALRGVVVLSALMSSLIAASMVHREADQLVFSEIESQRPAARQMAWRELASLSPALIAAAAVVFMAFRSQWLGHDWSQIEYLKKIDSPWADVSLLAMLAVAAAVLAAALGWTVRILGTLAFGKEAFGTGDIYILAAIGAAGGLSIAVIGFFLAAFLALAGVAILLVRKRSRAVPFGPWLALGAFLALFLRPPLMAAIAPALRFMWGQLTGQPDVY